MMKKGGLLTAAAHRVGLMGNAGLDKIIRAVCEHLKCEFPHKRRDRWALLRNFMEMPNTVPASRQFKRKVRAPMPAVATDEFLLSYEWRKLRIVVLKKRGARCECCGATPADGVRMHVDHVKPRRKYPELALEESNLQVLCEECNHGKGNWDETDWRQDHEPLVVTDEDLRALLH